MKPPLHPRRLVAALVLLAAARPLAAEPPSAPPVVLENTQHLRIAAAKIGRSYDVFVSLPEDYATSGRTYPVLYVLDGWHFPLMAFIQENNLYSKRMPPVIIANIGQSPAAEAMALRARDFSPTPISRVPGSGGAAAFLDFLEHELIPLIDRTYRTNPADRGLLGHSMGGLFGLYALAERPALFQRIVAASPAPLEWDDRALFKIAAEKLKVLPSAVRLDISTGDEPYSPAVFAFVALLDKLKPAGLDYRFTHFPGENHNSVRLVSFPHGLYWAYR